MTKIGYLIPEFPGQTHAFFMREREELRLRGVNAVLYSTRPPANGAAKHEWAQAAKDETTYLTPLHVRNLLSAVLCILGSGPVGWYRCLKVILAARNISTKDRIRIMAMLPVAASLVVKARQHGWQHIHIHSCANAAYLGVFLNQLSSLTYSLTLHGPLHDYGPNQALKWQHAKFVVVITQELIDSAKATLPATSIPRLLLAPMGVQLSHCERSSEYRPASNADAVRLVSCGRINPCKGHDDLIRAVHILRQQGIAAELTICGASDGRRMEYLTYLNELIREFNLEDVVTLPGSVSEERVRHELQRAHFFCLASHKEPLGVATMEAMAMEMPVIVTESPGVSEMIVSGVNGILVPAQSPEAFAEEISRLLSLPEEACRMAANARLTIENGFHSGVSAQAILSGIEGSPNINPVSVLTCLNPCVTSAAKSSGAGVA